GLHVHAIGDGSPTVVFEAGIGATSLSWRLIQPEIAKVTRTVSYDRAWLGWSEPTEHPRELSRVIDELRAVLDSGPRLLVAHSYGGLVAATYAARYTSEIAGIGLVDPVPAEEWANPAEHRERMLRRGIGLARRGALLSRLGLVRFALNLLTGGSRALPKFIARASSGSGAGFTERLVGQVQKLPRECWPMVQAHWCDPKSFE